MGSRKREQIVLMSAYNPIRSRAISAIYNRRDLDTSCRNPSARIIPAPLRIQLLELSPFSRDIFVTSGIGMCHTITTIHRCSHRSHDYRRCAKATLNPLTRRWNMCDTRSTTLTNQQQSLCGKDHCELTKKGGVWICCLCRFGYKDSDRNRYSECASCSHEVCEDCKEWNAENVAEMEAEDATAEAAGNDSSSAGDDKSQ